MAAARWTSVIMAIMLAFTAVGCSKESYSTDTSTVFSSGMVFSVSALGDEHEAAVAEMRAAIDDLDRSINPNREDSLLYAFNSAAAGETLEADEHLYLMATEARRLYEETEGAFDCSIEPYSRAWCVDVAGINKYVYGEGGCPESLPSASDLDAVAPAADISGFTASESDGKYYLTKTVEGLKLDFGGLAKGYAADLCRAIAEKHKLDSALIKISGNVVLYGDYYNGSDFCEWGVGVNNPRAVGPECPRYVCGFYCHGGVAVVTSGDYERCYDYSYGDGAKVKVCHVIDGARRMPIGVRYDEASGRYVNEDSYVISATVIGDNSMLADAYSTAVCVMGAEKGARFLQDKGYRGIIFTSDKRYVCVGDVRFSPGETLYMTDYEPLS